MPLEGRSNVTVCGAKKKLPITDSPEGPAAKRAHIPSPPPEDDAANFPGIHPQTHMVLSGSKYSDHAYGQFGSSDGTEVLKYPNRAAHWTLHRGTSDLQRIGRCTGGQATCVSGHKGIEAWCVMWCVLWCAVWCVLRFALWCMLWSRCIHAVVTLRSRWGHAKIILSIPGHRRFWHEP